MKARCGLDKTQALTLAHDAGKSWNLLGIDLIYAVELRAVDLCV